MEYISIPVFSTVAWVHQTMWAHFNREKVPERQPHAKGAGLSARSKPPQMYLCLYQGCRERVGMSCRSPVGLDDHSDDSTCLAIIAIARLAVEPGWLDSPDRDAGGSPDALRRYPPIMAIASLLELIPQPIMQGQQRDVEQRFQDRRHAAESQRPSGSIDDSKSYGHVHAGLGYLFCRNGQPTV